MNLSEIQERAEVSYQSYLEAKTIMLGAHVEWARLLVLDLAEKFEADTLCFETTSEYDDEGGYFPVTTLTFLKAGERVADESQELEDQELDLAHQFSSETWGLLLAGDPESYEGDKSVAEIAAGKEEA